VRLAAGALDRRGLAPSRETSTVLITLNHTRHHAYTSVYPGQKRAERANSHLTLWGTPGMLFPYRVLKPASRSRAQMRRRVLSWNETAREADNGSRGPHNRLWASANGSVYPGQ
jgi:hypothetical protein